MTEEVTPLDWVTRLADDVIAEAQQRNPGETIVCASGISPSGPIHLGNFRELITPHLVADEIRRRGIDCEHILSWDDFDRFRRVPKNLAGVDDSWEQYIGMPLTAVPAAGGVGARELGRPLQGAADRRHGGHRHRGAPDQPDRAVPRRCLPRPGAARHA